MPGVMSFVIETAELTPRNHGRIMAKLAKERAEFHARFRLQRHFERNSDTAPGGGYGYKKRSLRTIRRKLKKGVDPSRNNYLTGEMRSIILATAKATGTQYRWRVKARGTIKRPLPDWQAKELEAMSPEEVKLDCLWFAKQYSKLASTDQYRRKRRKRIGGK